MASYLEPSAEYSKLVNLLESSGQSPGDVYTELLKKEANSIELINRVVDHEKQKQHKATLFYNLPLLSIIALFVNTWKNIVLELVAMSEAKDYSSLLEIFTKKDRKVFIGLMFIIVAILLYVIDIVD